MIMAQCDHRVCCSFCFGHSSRLNSSIISSVPLMSSLMSHVSLFCCCKSAGLVHLLVLCLVPCHAMPLTGVMSCRHICFHLHVVRSPLTLITVNVSSSVLNKKQEGGNGRTASFCLLSMQQTTSHARPTPHQLCTRQCTHFIFHAHTVMDTFLQ